jgi:hypothetical protein
MGAAQRKFEEVRVAVSDKDVSNSLVSLKIEANKILDNLSKFYQAISYGGSKNVKFSDVVKEFDKDEKTVKKEIIEKVVKKLRLFYIDQLIQSYTPKDLQKMSQFLGLEVSDDKVKESTKFDLADKIVSFYVKKIKLLILLLAPVNNWSEHINQSQYIKNTYFKLYDKAQNKRYQLKDKLFDQETLDELEFRYKNLKASLVTVLDKINSKIKELEKIDNMKDLEKFERKLNEDNDDSDVGDLCLSLHNTCPLVEYEKDEDFKLTRKTLQRSRKNVSPCKDKLTFKKFLAMTEDKLNSLETPCGGSKKEKEKEITKKKTGILKGETSRKVGFDLEKSKRTGLESLDLAALRRRNIDFPKRTTATTLKFLNDDNEKNKKIRQLKLNIINNDDKIEELQRQLKIEKDKDAKKDLENLIDIQKSLKQISKRDIERLEKD